MGATVLFARNLGRLRGNSAGKEAAVAAMRKRPTPAQRQQALKKKDQRRAEPGDPRLLAVQP